MYILLPRHCKACFTVLYDWGVTFLEGQIHSQELAYRPFTTQTKVSCIHTNRSLSLLFDISVKIFFAFSAMGRIFFFGGMGAVVNSAIALHSSSYSIENLVSELLVQPFSAVRTLLPAALGFLFGTAILLIWSFIQAMVVRFLLDYNGWFLNPKSPINKVSPYWYLLLLYNLYSQQIWYLLMLLFLGKKNWGAGNYQLMLPTLPVPSLKKTCKRYSNWRKAI